MVLLTVLCTYMEESAFDRKSVKGVAKMQREARALRSVVSSGLARAFLDAGARLPPEIKNRQLYRDDTTKAYYSPTSAGGVRESGSNSGGAARGCYASVWSGSSGILHSARTCGECAAPIFARCCADRGDGDRPYYSTTSFGASGKILLYRGEVRPRLKPVAIRVCLTRQRLRYAAGARYCRLDRQLSGLAA